MTVTMVLLCLAGFALHFLGRYGEYWRTTEKVSPVVYVSQDWPGWLSAAIGTAATLLVLPELAPALGMQVSMTNLGALTAGYMGSSLAGKLPSLFTGKGAR